MAFGATASGELEDQREQAWIFVKPPRGLDPMWLYSVVHGEQVLASPASVPFPGSIWRCRGSLRASVLAALTGSSREGMAYPEPSSKADWTTLKLAWKGLAF